MEILFELDSGFDSFLRDEFEVEDLKLVDEKLLEFEDRRPGRSIPSDVVEDVRVKLKQ